MEFHGEARALADAQFGLRLRDLRAVQLAAAPFGQMMENPVPEDDRKERENQDGDQDKEKDQMKE